jgi:hypothetical protein
LNQLLLLFSFVSLQQNLSFHAILPYTNDATAVPTLLCEHIAALREYLDLSKYCYASTASSSTHLIEVFVMLLLLL